MPDPYFTAIEEHYRALKGRSSVMLSPADWRLVAVFKCSGIPVAIVLRGIDEAFQDFASRRKREEINSLAYCKPQIMEAWKQSRPKIPTQVEIEALKAQQDANRRESSPPEADGGDRQRRTA